MSYLIMHAPGGPFVLGDERGQNDARRDLGLDYVNRNGSIVPACVSGVVATPVEFVEPSAPEAK